jgi:hypothetical protein
MQTVQLPGGLGDVVSDGLQTAVGGAVQGWMQQHPTMAWIVTHPLLSAMIGLVLLLLLRGFLDAIARLTERVWLAILSVPLRLMKGLISLSTQLWNRSPANPSAISPSTQPQPLIALLDRLDALKQEQDEVLDAIRTHLNAERSNTEESSNPAEVPIDTE